MSGVMASPDEVGTEVVRPYVEHCLECFGWDRVVWGGDWPVCNRRTTLRQWVATSREIVRDAAPDDQRKLFSENATRIYGLSETGGSAAR
jgi:predicted TIM-barrel fold metal-dependent hydrolase